MKDLYDSPTHMCKERETTFSYRGSRVAMGIAQLVVLLIGLLALPFGILIWAAGLWSLHAQYGARCPSCKSTKALPIESPAAKRILSGKP